MTISVKNGARQLATHGLLWKQILKKTQESIFLKFTQRVDNG